MLASLDILLVLYVNGLRDKYKDSNEAIHRLSSVLRVRDLERSAVVNSDSCE